MEVFLSIGLFKFETQTSDQASDQAYELALAGQWCNGCDRPQHGFGKNPGHAQVVGDVVLRHHAQRGGIPRCVGQGISGALGRHDGQGIRIRL